MIKYGGNDTEIGWIRNLRWKKWLDLVEWQSNWMNKQIAMKQMIRYGGNASEIGWISKMRWNKWLEMVEMTGKLEE
jgi:hypothetical protein